MPNYKFNLRLAGGNYSNSGSSLYLDQTSGPSIQLQHSLEDFARLKSPFPAVATDLVLLALAAYGCDRSVARKASDDNWTRAIELEVPVSNPALWGAASGKVSEMLTFLTGDEWSVSFVAFATPLHGKDFKEAVRGFRQRKNISGSAVALFSGGLDSLIGCIDWLEANSAESITLSGAYDASAEGAAADQRKLLAHLHKQYSGRVSHVCSRMGVDGEGLESSYRSRSFCFMSFGVLAAQFLGGGQGLIVPENGAIALNYPLTRSRFGSLSTRTVHPYFVAQFQALLGMVGINCDVDNPYRFQTKGEMNAGCRNPAFLQSVYSDSMSCGKRKRYRKHVPGATAPQCGCCVPCIYRRSGLHKVGWPEGNYGVQLENPLTWGKLKLDDGNSDFWAIRDFVARKDSEADIWQAIVANGRVPLKEKDLYIDMVKRQRAEVEAWLLSKGIKP